MYLINFDLVLQQTLLHLGVGRHHATRGQTPADDGEEDGDQAHVVSSQSVSISIVCCLLCLLCTTVCLTSCKRCGGGTDSVVLNIFTTYETMTVRIVIMSMHQQFQVMSPCQLWRTKQ